MMEEVGKLAHHPRVGLVYDDRMCKHFDPNDENHIEKPDRIKAIWANLKSKGITHRCLVMKAKEAEDRNIALVHKKKYVDLIKTSSSKIDSKRKKIASKFNDVYLNKGSSQSAYLAAGAVIQVAEKTAKGELDSAVAIVRPPGHHAEVDTAMGFCFFNNVAIAASVLINEKPELGISKILIVDWDVHHGNGTQKMFWEDSRVLVFNVHRHDSGKFFPRGNDGSHSMIGEGLGTGYNVNVPWEQGNCGDADYFAVWDHVLIPITKDFNPDMILISGGFDAAAGDIIGGCSVTPEGYSVMMKKLMAFARGRIIMALEGGYNLESLSKSVLACVEALLENKPIIGSSKAEASPMETTWHVIEAVRKELSIYWPVLGHELPKTHKRTSSSETLSIASGEGTHASDEEEEDDQTTFKSGKQKTRPSKEAGEQGEGISRKKSKTSSQTKEFLDMYKVPIPKNLGKKDPALRSSGAEEFLGQLPDPSESADVKDDNNFIKTVLKRYAHDYPKSPLIPKVDFLLACCSTPFPVLPDKEKVSMSLALLPQDHIAMITMEYNRQRSLVALLEKLTRRNVELKNSLIEKEVVHASVLQTLTNERDVNAALSTEVAKLKDLPVKQTLELQRNKEGNHSLSIKVQKKDDDLYRFKRVIRKRNAELHEQDTEILRLNKELKHISDTVTVRASEIITLNVNLLSLREEKDLEIKKVVRDMATTVHLIGILRLKHTRLEASDALAKKENEELVKSSETAKAQFLEQIEKLTNDKETIQTQLREKAEELTRSQELFTTKLQVQTGELTTTREMADTQQLKIDELTKEKEATQIQMKSLAEKMSLLENHLSSVKQEVLQVRSETQDAINILSRDAVAKYAASYGLPAPEYSDDC